MLQNIDFSEVLFTKEIKSKTLLESIAEGVIIVDSESSIIYINNKTATLFNYSKDELIGKKLDILIPQKHKNAHGSYFQEYFKNPSTRAMGIGLILSALKKDGTVFPVEISLSHMNTTFGKIAFAFITDITIRKQTEDKLKERNEELDAFAHTLAHDLNSLLNTSVGYSNLLLSDDTITEDERIFMLEKINMQSKKMSQIVTEILTFANVGRAEIELEKVKITDVLNEAINRVQTLSSDFNATISIDEKIENCLGHANWLEEVWYNLISNAIKYGGRPPRVEILSQKISGGKIQYLIRDNGAGLSEDEIEMILEAPHKVKHYSIKGHGFGLSIVKRIIEKIGGEISVESKKSDGTEFIITLDQAD